MVWAELVETKFADGQPSPRVGKPEGLVEMLPPIWEWSGTIIYWKNA